MGAIQPRTITGPLSATPARPAAAPAAPQPAGPALEGEKYQDPARRGDLMNEASQFEYGDMPWGPETQANKALSAEDLKEVVNAHLKDPCQIKQANGYTCVATTMQRHLAHAEKGRYEKLISDLMTKGSAQLSNGDTLAVSEANKAFIASLDLSPAEKIDLTLQTAIMDYANGEAGYNAETGVSDDGRPGLSKEQTQAVFEKIIPNKSMQFVSDMKDFDSFDAFFADLKEKTAKQQWVALPLNREEVMAFATARDAMDQALDSARNFHVSALEDGNFQNAQDLFREAGQAGKVAHLVEIAEIREDGTVSVWDTQNGGFVHLSKEDFKQALQAAMGDDVGGTYSRNSTTYKKAAPPPPPKPKPPAGG